MTMSVPGGVWGIDSPVEGTGDPALRNGRASAPLVVPEHIGPQNLSRAKYIEEAKRGKGVNNRVYSQMIVRNNTWTQILVQ